MFLGDSINTAVSEFWQLAMTLASLKYIAGLVRQELDATSASTGHEEDNKQSTESHRPSHVDKKEAHSDNSFAKHEEIEPAAFISSVVSHSLPFQDASTEPEETQFNTSMVAHYQSNTEEDCVEHEDDVLSTVCHQTKIHFHMKEYQADPMVHLITDCMEDEEIVQTFLPSMVTHQLPAVATPAELSELPVSMSAHVISTNGEEEGDNMIETSQNISMMVHQITTEDMLIEQDVSVSLYNVIKEDINGNYEMNSEQELEVYDESLIVTDSVEQKLVEQMVIEEVCVSIQMDDNSLQTETGFILSMYTHQLPILETPIENSEYLVSMAVHSCYMCTMEDKEIGFEGDFETDPGMICSMVSHQIIMEDKSLEDTISHRLIEKYLEQSKPRDLESMDIKQEPFPSSMVAHQLPFLETPAEFSQFLVSTASHGSLTFKDEEEDRMIESYFEMDPGMLTSMVSHQVSIEDRSIENVCVDELTENNLKLTEPIDNESMNEDQLPFSNSIVAHQLPFLETPVEFSEFLVSTASYGCLSFKDESIMEDICFETDPGLISSMVSHHLIMEDKNIEDVVTDKLIENYLEMSKVIDHKGMNVKLLPLPSSMVAHQLPFLETPVEFSEVLVSASSHGYLSFKEDSIMEDNGFETDPGMICSMVSHQAGMKENDEGVLTEDLKENTLESSETIDYETIYIHPLPLPSSMVSHQLPFVETPTEFLQFLVSTASHGCLPNIHHGDDDKSDAGLLTSMLAHHQIIEPDNMNHYFKIMTSKRNVEVSYDLPQRLKEKECSTNLEVSNQKLEPHSDEESQCSDISMLTHQLPVLDVPTQLSEYLSSAATHGCISTHSDYFVESGLLDSMVAHQTMDITSTNAEDDTGVIHQVYTSYVEETEHMSKCLNTEYIPLKKVEIHKLQEDPESEMDSKIRGNDSKPEEETHLTSLISHQLPFLATCDQSEYTDCSTSMVYHLDMSAAYRDEENLQVENNKCLVSMVTHTVPNESCKDDNVDDKHSLDKTTAKTFSDVSSVHENQIVLNINAMEAETNISELVENNDNSYIDASQLNENTKESPQSIETDGNNCQDKRPVGIEEDEKISESCDNSVNAAQHTYNDSIAEAYSSKLTRIQELQRLVEDEIGEFENKRKNNNIMIENNVQTTETLIVNNVKDVEFKSCITIHHQFNNEFDEENNEEVSSDDESISSRTESINSVIFTSSDVITNHDEQNNYKDTFSSRRTSELNNSVENLIQATCTIGDNKPVIITTNQLQNEGLDFQDESEEEEMEQASEQIIESDNNQKEENYHNELGQNLELDNQQENNEDFNDLKMHLRKMPRKSSNIETKIREKELLSSLFKKSSKQTVEAKEQEKSQEKQQKSSMTIATLNENVKKETFKIRFKVRLNADSSKSSVLKYLFGCFGGEKIFHPTQ